MQHLELENETSAEAAGLADAWAEGYPPPASMLAFLELAERYWQESRTNEGSRRRGHDLALVNAGFGM